MGIGRYLTHVLGDIQAFCDELAEDLKMCVIEGALPSLPNTSDLYLKHCEGRDVQDSARTPRKEDDDESSGDEFRIGKTAPSVMTSESERSMDADFDPKYKHEGRRIDRNMALNKRTMAVRQKKGSAADAG